LEKHNHLLKNKKVVIVDELASSGDFMGNFDKLKSMMTGPFLNINPKGTNQFNIRNVLSWFLISNHEDCIRMEATDRRYFCLSVSEKYIGNKTYFSKLAKTFTPEAGDTFFTYIMQRGDNRDVNIRVPPMNAFKKTIISKGWSTSIRYLFEIKGKEYEEDEETDIKASDLFNNYTDWCHMNRQKVKSSHKFYSDIKTNITVNIRPAGTYYDLKSVRM
jgi:phage/plasmid-associated DNA primase